MKHWELQKSKVNPKVGQDLYDILAPFNDPIKDKKWAIKLIVVAQGVEKDFAQLIVRAVNNYKEK